MSTSDHKPALLPAILSMKCPSCRKGFVFKNKSMFPLGQTVDLKVTCDVCGQKLMSEKNNGAGMNYALTVIIFFLNLAWYCPLYISLKKNPNENWYENNSVEWYLASSTFIVIILQPLLWRMSRMLYLYLYTQFGASAEATVENRG